MAQSDIKNNEYMTTAYDDFKDRLSFQYLIANDLTNFDSIKEQLDLKPGNSSAEEIDVKSVVNCLLCPLIVPYVNWKMKQVFSVEANHFALVINRSEKGDRTILYGPGYHVLSYLNKLEGIYSFGDNLDRGMIKSSVGDLIIAKVDQGTIMHFECGGQNIMLGPGIHKILEPMCFKQIVQLDSFYIEIGPEKWVTVPDGYDGIAVNRGKIKVLKGGRQHHLAHAGEVFAKMVPKTIQTDRVPTDIPSYVNNIENNRKMNARGEVGFDPTQDLQTSTCEGSAVVLDAMIFWKITDTYLASQTVMEILSVEDGGGNNHTNQEQAIKAASKNITTLRKNVLRIAKNYLTALVGGCTLAGQLNDNSLQNKVGEEAPEEMRNRADQEGQQAVQRIQGQWDHQVNQMQQKQQLQQQQQQKEEENANKNNFQILSTLQKKSKYLKDIINKEYVKIGVILENICIFKVTPTNDIQRELDRQTKARVDANTAIINVLSKKEAGQVEYAIQRDMAIEKAKANSKVTIMEANAQAESEVIRANGEAEAITILAQSRRDEAEKLESKEFAKKLAQIRVAGQVGSQIFQNQSNSFVFGQNPGDIIYGMMNKLGQIEQ